MVEENSSHDYCCKVCSQNETSGKSNNVIVLPRLAEEQVNSVCSAQTILEEDTDNKLCNVCYDRVEDGQGEICSVCNHICHIDCFEEIEDGDTAVCYLCKVAGEQNLHQYDENENSQTDQIDPQTEIQTDSRASENVDKTMKKANLNKSGNQTQTDENVQYLTSEMRQKHLKLKKLEQDIKLKEKTLQDSTKDRTRLESRLLQLESQNEELLSTIKTLKRKIAVLEETTDTQQIHVLQNDSDRSSSTPKTQNELINNIHQKVTNYILKQIDTQLDKLDIMNDTGVKPSPCQKTTPDNHARNKTEQIPTTEQAQAMPFKHPDLVTQNKPTLFIPNGQMLHNLHGPPVQYMQVPTNINDLNRTVRTPYQLTKPTMRSSTRNSRTPCSTANIQRTGQKSSLTDKRKPVTES